MEKKDGDLDGGWEFVINLNILEGLTALKVGYAWVISCLGYVDMGRDLLVQTGVLFYTP